MSNQNNQSHQSVLSAQYNNVQTSLDNLANIRGSGQFSTDYPLSSNYPMGSDKNFYDNSHILASNVVDVNMTDTMPVGIRKNSSFEYAPSLSKTYKGDPYQSFGLAANHSVPTVLNMLFFSKTNVQYIQKKILDEVEKITGIRVKPQSENSILIIMNNKYQYSLTGGLPASPPHLALPRGDKNCSLETRLTRINQAVIQECVKQVLSGMYMYAEYYKQASSLPLPMELPQLVTHKGRNVLSPNIGLTSGQSDSIASYNMRNTIIN